MEDLRKLNVEELIREAEAGNPEAQCRLGSKYGIGRDVKRNRKIAVKWYKTAADQGYADGQYRLGSCYWQGNGIAQDRAKAYQLWKLAADQGHRGAQIRIGDCYYTGEGVEQNREEAVRLYTLANATEKLIECYRDGCSVKLDVAAIIKEWQDAFERSRSHSAMLGLARLYSDGLLMEPDYEKAAQWWLHAAQGDDGIWEHGHSDAHYELACYYREGRGVERDEHRALFHFYATVAAFRDEDRTCSFDNEPEYVTNARWMLVEHGDEDMIAKVKRAARNGSAKAKEILEEFGLNVTRSKAEEEKALEEIVIIDEPKSTPLVEVLVGEKVYHKAFGEGVVSEADGCVVGVDFESAGKKRFVNPDAFIDGFLTKTTV